MQNHPIYKTTPEQGWSQMVPVLDKAMPVARRSRRILAYWWTAAAVIMAVVSTRIATLELAGPANDQVISERNEQNSSGIQTDPAQHSTNSSIAGTDFDSPTSTTGKLKNNAAAIESQNEIAINEKQTNNQIVTPAENYKSGNLKVNSTQPKLKVDESLTALVPAVISAQNIIPTSEGKKDGEEAVVLTDINKDLHTIDVAAHEMIDLPSLSSLEIDALPIESFVMDDIQPGRITRAFPKKKLFTPHVEASVLETYASGMAAYAGGGVDINILPKLSITTGAGCSIYNPELTVFSANNARTESEDYESLLKSDLSNQGIPQYLPADAFSNSSPAVLTQYVSSIRQWHLSAGLKYDLSRRFYVEGGVTFNMLSSVHSKYPIISVLLVNDPYTGGNLDVSHSFEEFNLIQSQSNSFYAGLGYRPSKKTEVFAQWVHSADSYLKGSSLQGVSENEDGDYMRGLSLGFRYNL